jgi:glycosyltransferase involved in cell wall biosynthesis
MRIIQIIDVRWYNACADFAVKQAEGLILAGHDVLLMANPGSPPEIKAREVGLNVSEAINFSGAGRVFGGPGKLRRIALDYKADIVFAHRGESHLMAGLAARGEKFKVARFRGDLRTPRSNPMSRHLNNHLTGGIAVSTEFLKFDYEKKFKLNGIPIRVIYPGIDNKVFQLKSSKETLKKKFNLKSDGPVIGIIGRLSPVKGHRYFIEAVKLVSMKYPTAQYVIAGGDAQISEAELKISAAMLKIPNLHFFGLLENIAELISALDIGVISSTGSEMICRVLLEYYAAGLPVVATAVNQISEIVLQSDAGILVEPGNSVSMGKALIELLQNPNKSRELAQHGQNWVARHSLLDLGNKTASFLQEVIDA